MGLEGGKYWSIGGLFLEEDNTSEVGVFVCVYHLNLLDVQPVTPKFSGGPTFDRL